MYDQQSSNIRRQRQQNPVMSVFLQNNPQRIYSITVPPSKEWCDFIPKIKKQFHLSSDTQITIYPHDNLLNSQPFNTENSMIKIPHKTKFCIVIENEEQSLHSINNSNTNNNMSTNDNSNDSNSDSSSSPTKINGHKIANLHLMNESFVQPQFGLDLDIFGRFSSQKRTNSKKMKNRMNIYHFYDYKKMELNFNPKNIWKQLFSRQMIVKHIDQKYSLMTLKTEEENDDQNDLPLFTIRTRRLIWPRNVQMIENEFEYKLSDVSNWMWAIFICHGGKFAGAIYKGKNIILHKTLRRYVVRGKQGKRQINHLSTSGVKSGSAGGYKRSANEQKLLNEIRGVLSEWQIYLQMKCQKIFIHLPGKYNSGTFFGTSDEQNFLYPKNMQLSEERLMNVMNKNKNKNVNLFRLRKKDERIVQIPITTHSVTLHEIERVHYWLSTYWMSKKIQ